VEYIKGVGPQRADLLKKELGIFHFRDLLEHYPLRHLDKTRVEKIKSLNYTTEYAQVTGRIRHIETLGEKRSKRLVAYLRDDTGELELTWFQGVSWIEKMLVPGQAYLVFGKVGFFNNRPQIVHPELEPWVPEKAAGKPFLDPIYPTTEKLKARGINGRTFSKYTYALFQLLTPKDLPENLPQPLLSRYRLMSRWDARCHIHFPASEEHYQQAVRRIKFEELFFAQLRLGLIRSARHRFSKGFVFETVGDLFNRFYSECLPYELTGAQKRVLREIRRDLGAGRQMNRLLQGDVGSGKTIVALLCALIAAGNSRAADGVPFQTTLMAPTEILAQQHFNNIRALVKELPFRVELLTGSTKGKQRKDILAGCAEGSIHLLIGTHAVIEDKVVFANLGLAIVDEQHKFGVAQRAALWKKNSLPPHILVMTATPIPRTLALTAYGDLDYSVIDELPPGRQPIQTLHRPESQRPRVMDFVREQIDLGRQAYFVYPLIEESAKVDYENLMKGYEEVKSFFPEPRYWISMVHGRQTPEQKEVNMQRFASHDTQLMVSTTVIEVGVNVPNASIMVIESAEKFGLSQLHQLRGRVGRGSEKSFCILLTGPRVSRDAKERINIMCATNDGFRIAEKDLELRGPGDIEGTRQSGVIDFKLASIVQDKAMLEVCKEEVFRLLEADEELNMADNLPVKMYLQVEQGKTAWSKIS